MFISRSDKIVYLSFLPLPQQTLICIRCESISQILKLHTSSNRIPVEYASANIVLCFWFFVAVNNWNTSSFENTTGNFLSSLGREIFISFHSSPKTSVLRTLNALIY